MLAFSIPFKGHTVFAFKRKKINSLLLAYVVVLGALAVAGYFAEDFNIRFHRQKMMGPETSTALVFYSLPRMDLTLASPLGADEHVKITLNLQVMRKNLSKLEDFQPRISDTIIRYLRTQDIEEIRKPAFSSVLRQSLTDEANKVTNNQPLVTDVVFREFLVQ